jgi:hypothetical protein
MKFGGMAHVASRPSPANESSYARADRATGAGRLRAKRQRVTEIWVPQMALIGPECSILNQTIILNYPTRETTGYTISEVAAYSSRPLTGG